MKVSYFAFAVLFWISLHTSGMSQNPPQPSVLVTHHHKFMYFLIKRFDCDMGEMKAVETFLLFVILIKAWWDSLQ